MAQNEMRAMHGMPVAVRLSEWLGRICRRDLLFAVALTELWRIVVPSFMRRNGLAGRALRYWPLDAAARTYAACPKRMPPCATGRSTDPAILMMWVGLALGAVDFGAIILH